MNKIKNFITKNSFLDVIFIIFIVILLSCLVANHLCFIFPDRGRELILPLEILNGKVPYKDITLIYFPTSYYINAIIYKLLGISMNSLLITQTFLCTAFVLIYYFFARLFIDRLEAFLLTLYIILSCIFASSDIFSFIMPYSYGRTYGIFSFFICLICFIKLYRTDNLKYLYFASVIIGFCASLKMEFLSAYLLLGVGLLLYKKLKFTEYLKAFFLSLIFPIIVLTILFIQGVKTDDIISIIQYSISFSKTPAMIKFLANSGMYPNNISFKIEKLTSIVPIQLTILFFSFIALKYAGKFKISLIIAALILWFNYYFYRLHNMWVYLPILMFTLTIINFKNLLKNNRDLLFILIAALILSQREFFLLTLAKYGEFSLPLLLLGFCIFIDKYAKPEFFGVKTKNFICYIFVILIGFYVHFTYDKYNQTKYLIKTDRGSVHVGKENYMAMTFMTSYIKSHIKENESVLVLPEGNIVNFMTKRKNNMKCFMMDRLYYDAYGDEKATTMVAGIDSDYIFIIKSPKLHDFHSPYLYEEHSNLLTNYIEQEYIVVNSFVIKDTSVKVLKNKRLAYED